MKGCKIKISKVDPLQLSPWKVRLKPVFLQLGNLRIREVNSQYCPGSHRLRNTGLSFLPIQEGHSLLFCSAFWRKKRLLSTVLRFCGKVCPFGRIPTDRYLCRRQYLRWAGQENSQGDEERIQTGLSYVTQQSVGALSLSRVRQC